MSIRSSGTRFTGGFILGFSTGVVASGFVVGKTAYKVGKLAFPHVLYYMELVEAEKARNAAQQESKDSAPKHISPGPVEDVPDAEVVPETTSSSATYSQPPTQGEFAQ